jgi:hypothetical protein
MRQLVLVVLVLLLVTFVLRLPAEARRRSVPQQPATVTTSEQEVLRDFERILDLWRDGRYDELFERTATSRESREQFAKRLASAPRKPACCWEKMQDARVSLKTDSSAVVKARLGFDESLPGTRFVTKGVKMKKEDGVWMISQADLFTLANLSKKRASYKYLPIQAK